MLSYLFIFYFQIFVISASGNSDQSMELSYQKAIVHFQRELSLQIRSKMIPDSLIPFTQDLSSSYFQIHQFTDTLQRDPLLFEFITHVKWTYDVQKNEFPLQDSIMLIEGKPYWVVKGIIQYPENYYYGIGVSDSSFTDAKNRALIAFAENVELKVISIFREEKLEENEQFISNKKSMQQVLTDLSISGLTMRDQFVDENISQSKYYVLYEYEKNRYHQNILDQLKNKFQLQITELEQKNILKKSQAEFNQSEEISKKLELETEILKNENEKTQEQLFYDKYRDFLEMTNQSWLISRVNAEFPNHYFFLAAGADLDRADQWHYYLSANLFILELFNSFQSDKSIFYRPEYGFRLQLLKRTGTFNKISLSLGFTNYSTEAFQTDSIDKSYDEINMEKSLFVSGNILLPETMHSIGTVYMDKKELFLAVKSYPLFKQMKTDIALVGELHLLFNRNYGNKFKDPFYFNFGIQFKIFNNYTTSISFRDNHLLTLNLSFGILENSDEKSH